MPNIKSVPDNLLATLLLQIDGKSTAIWHEEGQLSYADLTQAVMKMASFYRSKGLQPQERVMIMLPDGVAWVVSYLGAIWAGVIPIGVNPYATASDFEVMYQLAAPHFMVAGTMCQPLLEAAGVKQKEENICFISHDHDLLGLLAYHQTVAAYLYEQGADLFWVFTSGSSGQPKAIIHSANAIDHSIQFAREVLAVDANDRLYATSRLFFAYPLANVLFAALGCGASMILHRAWPSCENMTSVLKQHKPTVVFSVPTLYRQLLRQADFPLLLEGVRYCVSAGEHLSDYLIKAWRNVSPIPLMNGYGMSETLSFILYGNIDGSPGLQTAPGVIVYSSHQWPSRLCFSHPGLYKRHKTLTEEWTCTTVYISDDIFVEVAPQRLKFQCRADFLFKVKGRFIHSVEEESHLLTYCAVELKDAAVICESDAVGEPQVVWCVVANDILPFSLIEEKLNQLKQALPHYRQPAMWRYYDVLPRTSTGKIIYRQLIGNENLPRT